MEKKLGRDRARNKQDGRDQDVWLGQDLPANSGALRVGFAIALNSRPRTRLPNRGRDFDPEPIPNRRFYLRNFSRHVLEVVMMIRIQYPDGRYDMVKVSQLDRFIAADLISGFRRATGWVVCRGSW